VKTLAAQNTFCKSGVCGAVGHMFKLFIKSFILLDQGHVFFTFTSMEAEFITGPTVN
jgi:hypothetical protein